MRVETLGALLWEVTSAEGARLLYVGGPGPLGADTLEALAGRAYDLVLLNTPADDPAFAATLDVLRDCGAVAESADVVAVGARSEQREPAGGRRVLVLGGARSGKSTYAERLLAVEPAVDYVATSGERPDDPDWVQRVAEHRARRPATWRTLETTDIEGVLATPGPPVLIDCLALWLTAVLDEVGAWEDATWDDVGRDAVQVRIESLVAAWRDTPRYVVAVSNEVGSGVVPSYPSGIRFRDELGKLNMRLADVSDRVVLLVAGRPLDLTPERTA